MTDEKFRVEKTLPSGGQAVINAESAEEYMRLRDFAEKQDKWAAHEEAAVEGDRRWFRARPKRFARVRRRQHMEMAGQAPSRYVLVVRLPGNFGIRARLPIPDGLAEELLAMRKIERDRAGTVLVQELKSAGQRKGKR